MDGVLFRGNTAFPAASDFLSFLSDQGRAFTLLTNNSSLTPEANVRRLQGMGISVSAEHILTSSLVTAEYLLDQGAAGQKAVVIGEQGVLTALTGSGIEVTDEYEDAQWVVAGIDRHITYEKLCVACLAIESGAHFVATNSDSSLPVEEGLVPGAGAIQAAITTTTRVAPVVIGKPETRMLSSAMDLAQATPEETVVLGDRLDTDIRSANRAGVRSILVLTGVSSRSDFESSADRPDAVFEDLPSLMETIRS